MDVILKQDVERLGAKNDIVAVKNGYARNYLIPQGFACRHGKCAQSGGRDHPPAVPQGPQGP